MLHQSWQGDAAQVVRGPVQAPSAPARVACAQRDRGNALPQKGERVAVDEILLLGRLARHFLHGLIHPGAQGRGRFHPVERVPVPDPQHVGAILAEQFQVDHARGKVPVARTHIRARSLHVRLLTGEENERHARVGQWHPLLREALGQFEDHRARGPVVHRALTGCYHPPQGEV